MKHGFGSRQQCPDLCSIRVLSAAKMLLGCGFAAPCGTEAVANSSCRVRRIGLVSRRFDNDEATHGRDGSWRTHGCDA